MKKLGILLMIVSLSAVTVQAQNMQNRGLMAPGMEQIVTKYGDQINITDEQLADIAERQLQFRETMRTARLQNRASRGQQQERRVRQGENLRGQHSQTILSSVLTDSQMNELKELMKDRAEFNHRFTTVRQEKIVEHVGLEGDKRSAVLDMMNRHADQRHQMQLKMIDNPGSVDADERRKMMETMRADRDELKSMLTVEEYENLMQLMNSRQNGPERGMNQRPNNRRQNR